MERKKRLRLLQTSLLIFGVLVVFLTYSNYGKNKSNYTNTPQNKKDASNQLSNSKERSDIFYDIEYSGLDFSGNRYIIKSEIANFDTETPEIINMKIMKTIFYFKDGTTMTLTGDYGTYNNKTFDMEFRDNIVAEYQNNLLYADNLIYLNTKSLLTIYGNVMTESVQGNINADNVEIDLSAETLDISMFDEKQINVNLRN